MKKIISFLFILILAFSAFAQKDLINQDVVDMCQSGLSQEIIVAKIRNSKNTFDTSPDALKNLSDAKVPDLIIIAMMESGKSAVTTTAAIVESKEPEAVRRAVKALRRLASSTDVGVSYVNYSPLVADVKTEVEDALSDIENASIKEALRSSLTEYEFASSVWQATWRTDFIEGDLRNVAVSRYGVQKRGLLKVVWRDDFLAAIWRQGRNKFEIANSLLAQTNTKNIDSDDSLAGAWKITIVKDSKSVEFDMTITKTVGGYSGVLRSTMGNSTPVQVNRDGNTITFSYSERQKKSLLVVDFRGSLENGKITGAIVFTQNGKGEDAPFTAVKL